MLFSSILYKAGKPAVQVLQFKGISFFAPIPYLTLTHPETEKKKMH